MEKELVIKELKETLTKTSDRELNIKLFESKLMYFLKDKNDFETLLKVKQTISEEEYFALFDYLAEQIIETIDVYYTDDMLKGNKLVELIQNSQEQNSNNESNNELADIVIDEKKTKTRKRKSKTLATISQEKPVKKVSALEKISKMDPITVVEEDKEEEYTYVNNHNPFYNALVGFKF